MKLLIYILFTAFQSQLLRCADLDNVSPSRQLSIHIKSHNSNKLKNFLTTHQGLQITDKHMHLAQISLKTSKNNALIAGAATIFGIFQAGLGLTNMFYNYNQSIDEVQKALQIVDPVTSLVFLGGLAIPTKDRILNYLNSRTILQQLKQHTQEHGVYDTLAQDGQG